MNKRMVAIIKMLSSTSDGEVVNAARSLGRMLEAAGLDWNDLGDYLARWPGMKEPDKPQPQPEKPRTQTYSGGAQQPGWKRRSEQYHVDVELVGEQVTALSQYTRVMRRADRDFIESLEAKLDMYGERTFVSEAQAKWVNDLYERHCARRR
jgi:hypothetical protein